MGRAKEWGFGGLGALPSENALDQTEGEGLLLKEVSELLYVRLTVLGREEKGR